MAPFEQDEIGPDLFEAACRMELEGIVSKHRERDYKGWPTLGSRSRTAAIPRWSENYDRVCLRQHEQAAWR